MLLTNIRVGEAYAYSDRRKVTVLAVEPRTDMIQVRFHNGYELWVYPYQIMCTWEQAKREREQAKQANAQREAHEQSVCQQAEMTEEHLREQGLNLSIYGHSFRKDPTDDTPQGKVAFHGTLADLARLLRDVDPDCLPDSRLAQLEMNSHDFLALLDANTKRQDALDDLLGKKESNR